MTPYKGHGSGHEGVFVQLNFSNPLLQTLTSRVNAMIAGLLPDGQLHFTNPLIHQPRDQPDLFQIKQKGWNNDIILPFFEAQQVQKELINTRMAAERLLIKLHSQLYVSNQTHYLFDLAITEVSNLIFEIQNVKFTFLTSEAKPMCQNSENISGEVPYNTNIDQRKPIVKNRHFPSESDKWTRREKVQSEQPSYSQNFQVSQGNHFQNSHDHRQSLSDMTQTAPSGRELSFSREGLKTSSSNYFTRSCQIPTVPPTQSKLLNYNNFGSEITSQTKVKMPEPDLGQTTFCDQQSLISLMEITQGEKTSSQYLRTLNCQSRVAEFTISAYKKSNDQNYFEDQKQERYRAQTEEKSTQYEEPLPAEDQQELNLSQLWLQITPSHFESSCSQKNWDKSDIVIQAEVSLPPELKKECRIELQPTGHLQGLQEQSEISNVNSSDILHTQYTLSQGSSFIPNQPDLGTSILKAFFSQDPFSWKANFVAQEQEKLTVSGSSPQEMRKEYLNSEDLGQDKNNDVVILDHPAQAKFEFCHQNGQEKISASPDLDGQFQAFEKEIQAQTPVHDSPPQRSLNSSQTIQRTSQSKEPCNVTSDISKQVSQQETLVSSELNSGRDYWSKNAKASEEPSNNSFTLPLQKEDQHASDKMPCQAKGPTFCLKEQEILVQPLSVFQSQPHIGQEPTTRCFTEDHLKMMAPAHNEEPIISTTKESRQTLTFCQMAQQVESITDRKLRLSALDPSVKSQTSKKL